MGRSGFTVIEFLFTSLIISILILVIFISTEEARTTAQANNIIRDIANLRIAYSVLYGERDNEINTNNIYVLRKTFTIDSLMNYIDKGISGTYELYIDDSGSWFAVHRVEDGRTKQKLAGHAISSGLLGSDSPIPLSPEQYTGQNYVIAQLR